MFFSSCHERGTRKNSDSLWGIVPHTFGFRARMLFHWAAETLWWVRPIMKVIWQASCILLGSATSLASCFVTCHWTLQWASLAIEPLLFFVSLYHRSSLEVSSCRVNTALIRYFSWKLNFSRLLTGSAALSLFRERNRYYILLRFRLTGKTSWVLLASR